MRDGQVDEQRHVTEFEKERRIVQKDDGIEFLHAYHDASGAPLGDKEAYKARIDQVRPISDMNLYDKVQIEECWGNTGEAPIGTKWLDIKKGLKRSKITCQDVLP